VHLGFSRSKPGYVLEVLEGPRKGRVITSSQVKFRENMFPLKEGYRPKDNLVELGLWHDLDWNMVGGDEVPEPHSDASDDESVSDYYDPEQVASGPNSDNEDSEHDARRDQGADGARVTRSSSSLPDWRDVYNALDRQQHARSNKGVFYTSCADGAKAYVEHPQVQTQTPRDAQWAPQHYTNIRKVPDDTLRREWYSAHFAENDGLFTSGVLRVVPLPPNVDTDTLQRLRTIYTVKSDGRKKARTVLSARKGKFDASEFGRTYSPTARPTTFRLLCSYAAMHGDMVIRGGDVKQAYTQAVWPEGMRKTLAHMPDGYEKYYDGVFHVVEVGNIYGHPIAGKNWWTTFKTFQLEYGFKQSQHDPCLFTMQTADDFLHVIVYVDDILDFSPRGSNLRAAWATTFGTRFAWTDFGTDLHDFLSVHVRQSPGCVELDMDKYIQACVAEAFPGGVHHAYARPAVSELADIVYRAGLTKDKTYSDTALGARFRRITMQCLYVATQVKPDIALAVGLLTRVQAWPNPELLQHAERVLIYLSGVSAVPLRYTKTTDTDLNMMLAPRVAVVPEGYSDADFSLAHSTTGYVFMLGNAAVSWATKKQHSIALSTYQAEIMAGSLAACEAVSIRGICADIGFPQLTPTVLKMDNSGAIDLANDPVQHAKSKHIARRDLFLRELVERGIIVPKYVPTSANIADALTKPLDRSQFVAHRATMLGHTT